jgi:N-acetylmuramoyl-L-alanine amidase
MSQFSKRHLLIVALTLALMAIVALFLLPTAPRPAPPQKTSEPEVPALSLLAEPPDWKSLESYQNTITREEFKRLLTNFFTTGDAWRNYIAIDDAEARINTGDPADGAVFHLRFAQPEHTLTPPRPWRTAAELPPAPGGKPLADMKIAIDPGHIGGEWAKVEERWMVAGGGKPVCEGDMTLFVANLLKPELEALGATVSLVRETSEPVTSLRPEGLLDLARSTGAPGASTDQIRRTAERLFYRTAEIRARAELVNRTLKPDLVLCLHFNAEAWGDALNPTLIDRSHLHLLVNGAYDDSEVILADQRFALLQKLLQRTYQEEIRVGSTIADTFAQASGLPPFLYQPGSGSVRAIPGQTYLWARNLLANRLYDCPVIFMEPYVMNSTTDYARIQAGDYEGEREIAGKLRQSIFREYANALAQGLAKHYASERAMK